MISMQKKLFTFINFVALADVITLLNDIIIT